jgi:hypothetical protein
MRGAISIVSIPSSKWVSSTQITEDMIQNFLTVCFLLALVYALKAVDMPP